MRTLLRLARGFCGLGQRDRSETAGLGLEAHLRLCPSTAIGGKVIRRRTRHNRQRIRGASRLAASGFFPLPCYASRADTFRSSDDIPSVRIGTVN
jgi:hypothetical protein